jgi:hypothetical protein
MLEVIWSLEIFIILEVLLSLNSVSILIWLSMEVMSILELIWMSLEIFCSFEICFVIVVVVDANNVVVD